MRQSVLGSLLHSFLRILQCTDAPIRLKTCRAKCQRPLSNLFRPRIPPGQAFFSMSSSEDEQHLTTIKVATAAPL
jgi:hypothetical protein